MNRFRWTIVAIVVVVIAAVGAYFGLNGGKTTSTNDSGKKISRDYHRYWRNR
nr:hypothetical protein [Oenococcus oeni]